jgi:Family of unknown function (DUF5329)
MSRRWRGAAWLILGLAGPPVAQTAPPTNTQAEVSYLLGFVEASGCEFYRNGNWYDSKSARAHLQSKYEFLIAANQIGTAEDFIEKAATRSSLSGRPYNVRCRDGVAVASAQWLREALACYRKTGPECAPRAGTRGALPIGTYWSTPGLSRPF